MVKADPTKNKSGRPRSGKPRNEIDSESSANYRKNQESKGKSLIHPWVEAQTKTNLNTLKAAMDLDSYGDVIDILVFQEVKRLKLK